jgi:cytochrome c peroxidase
VIINLCFALFASLLALSSSLSSAQNADSYSTAIPDALQPQFTPPPPGTYTLPIIDTVSDYTVLNTEGKPTNLFALTADKIAVISFMYTSCADVGGCPLAAAVLQQLDQLLSQRPETARQVTLLSVSFDPERDTPARMAETRQHLQPRTDWHFLTATNAKQLQPMLTDFNQPIAKLTTQNGEWSGLFRHVLKVYLLDQHHRVRNIYSTGLFSAQLVLNDIETILLETRKRAVTNEVP